MQWPTVKFYSREWKLKNLTSLSNVDMRNMNSLYIWLTICVWLHKREKHKLSEKLLHSLKKRKENIS